MPVVAELVSHLRRQGFVFPSNVMVFGVQHIMSQTLVLCAAFNSLGITAKNIALCGKPYSTDLNVVRSLNRQGVMTVPTGPYRCDRLQSLQQIEDLNELGDVFLRRRNEVGDSIVLVLDDGGHALTRFNALTTSPYRIAGIEQTASGFWQPGAEEVPFPVIDVGTSACKRILEPDLIVDASVRRALRVINRFSGRCCGVIGLGYLGAALARRLLSEGASLSVFDARPKAMERFEPFAAGSIHEVFDRSDIIFGCAGVDVTKDLFEEKGGALSCKPRILASLSSGDDEFFSLKAALLDSGTFAHQTYQTGQIPDIEGRWQGSPIKILRNGFPVNFDNTSESVPLEHIQGTVAALIIATCQAYQYAMSIGDRPNIGRVMLDVRAQKWLFERWLKRIPNSQHLSGKLSLSRIASLSALRTTPRSVNNGTHFAPWPSSEI